MLVSHVLPWSSENAWSDCAVVGDVEDMVKRTQMVRPLNSSWSYNPQARQWNIYFATPQSGLLGPPLIGQFQGERGEFYYRCAPCGSTANSHGSSG
jgi:hypothetical protein